MENEEGNVQQKGNVEQKGEAAGAAQGASSSGRLYVLAPVGRDAPLAQEAFAEAGLACTACAEVGDLPDDFARTAGALLLTEEALSEDLCATLREALAEQPAWSDLPLVVLVDEEQNGRKRLEVEAALRPSENVTVLERPLAPPTLVAVVRSALRDRRRQREVQRLLEERERSQNRLEQRVSERTSDLQKRNRQVRALAASLTTAEQKERERIAQVLHDQFQQLLYGLRLHLQTLHNGVPPARETELLSRMDASVGEAIDLTRTLASELNPPALETEGFGAALPRLADQMEERYGLTVTLEGEHPGPVPRRELRVLLFRLARELLFNVARHAETDRATLTTRRRDGRLTVRVEDEGAGFAPQRVRDERTEESGFGLFSMEERLALFGGSIDIEAAPGEGARVTLTVPAEGE